MNMLFGHLQSLFNNFAPFFILLGILIFVHELGHFLVAKFFGVRVEVFSLGFGKKIIHYTRGDTAYCLSLIPLGGYVKMYGDDPSAEIPADQSKYAFLHKPVWQRFLVVLAGPMMNLFFAILVFSFIAGTGEDVAGPFIGDVATESTAFKAGFRSGDKVLALDGEEVRTWSQVQKKIEAAGGSNLHVSVARQSETQPVQFDAPVVFAENDNIFSSSRQVGQIAGLTQESRSTLVGISDPHGPAGTVGIPSMGLLVSVNGKKVSVWRDLQSTILGTTKSGAKTVTVQMRDVEKPDKPENLQTFEIPLNAGWSEKTDMPAWLGLEPGELYIYQVKRGSPADTAGLLAKDKVVKIAGEPIHEWNNVLTRVKNFDPLSEGMDVTVTRSGEEKTFKIKPEMTTLMNAKMKEEKRYTIGIVSGFFPMGPESVYFRVSNPLQMIQRGFAESMYWTDFVMMSFVRLLQGDVSAKNLGGAITIGRVAAHSFAAGLSTFLRMMGLISINLFLINLLPVPVLDGGHLVFYSIEALRGTPLSMRKMEIAQQVGLMLLMFLMAFAFFNDLTNLWASRM